MPSWANWIFDVNGRTQKHLETAIQAALVLSESTIAGYKVDEKLGILLYTYIGPEDKEIIKFPFKKINVITEALWELLNNTEFKWNVKYDRWEEDLDHDGDNNGGFRLRTGDWGKFKDTGAFLVLRPVLLWYGK